MDIPDVPSPESIAAYKAWLASLDPAKCRPAGAPSYSAVPRGEWAGDFYMVAER